MKQLFEHYQKWEDYQAGMYRDVLPSTEASYQLAASELLSNAVRLEQAMMELCEKWVIAAAVNLTNRGQNRRAWLGQAACLFADGVPEHLVRQAWNQLGSDVQRLANAAATRVIEWYEAKHDEEVNQCLRRQLELTF